MSYEFEEFTAALEKGNAHNRSSGEAVRFQRVTVLGGGPRGRLAAALYLAQGCEVTLFSAYAAELGALRESGGVTLRGSGPVGTYQTDLQSAPSIRTTAELDTAVADADLIFVTGPVHKHRTYAMVLADHLVDGQTLVIAPARSFAALETEALLKVGGCEADVAIVELLKWPYWISADGAVIHLSDAGESLCAALPSHRMDRAEAVAAGMPGVVARNSMLQSSFADASGAVEVVALMTGESPITQSEIRLPPGAQPLEERRNFRSLICSSQCRKTIVAALAERRAVAAKYGVRNLPSDEDWICQFAGDDVMVRPQPSAEQSVTVLRNAVSGSLVPLQSAGRLVGVCTPLTDSLIALAGVMLGGEITASGRRLESLGVHGNSTDEVRKIMESIARGHQ